MSVHLTEGREITDVGFGTFQEKDFTKFQIIITVISCHTEGSG